MSASKIRIATIGTWGHLGQPLSELTGLPDIEFVAHARATAEDDVREIHRITHDVAVPWHEDYRRMLREIRPDVVIISTRIDRINPIAIEAAQAQCHLICEKPLAIDHAGLKNLYDLCQSNKVQCIAMLGNGRHPAMQAAGGILRSGSAGEVVLANARKSYKWGGNRPEWFGDRKAYGTTISWIAVHAVEMIHVLSGQEFTTVAAMQSNIVHRERPACQDNGLLLLGLSGGGHASVSFDYLRPAVAATHGDDWVRIVGSRGVVEANLDQGWCRFVSDQSPQQEVPLPPAAAYYGDFIHGLTNSGPGVEMRRSFMLTHVCLCAADSADTGQFVKLGKMPWDAEINAER